MKLFPKRERRLVRKFLSHKFARDSQGRAKKGCGPAEHHPYSLVLPYEPARRRAMLIVLLGMQEYSSDE